MTEIAKTKQLVINLAADHPVFELDEKKRPQQVRQILDHYYENGQTSEVDLVELNARVAILSTKIEMLEEVLQAVKEIKDTLLKSPPQTLQPLVEQTKPSQHGHPPKENPLEATEKAKNVKFDVDAFFDLG